MPRVGTALTWRDHLGTVGARSGSCRGNYKVVPGLYCVGDPDAESPILVTANYKLSFDALRKELAGIDAWILVADTRGINVWCAAGKKTFSTEEVAYQVHNSRLAEIVRHRQLILPQLAAVGVAAGGLKRACGFTGTFGPVQARDIPAFLKRDRTADEAMRTVTFGIGERAVLIPVEIFLMWKPLLLAIAVLFLISGIGPDIYSLGAAWQRGAAAAIASLLAVVAGAAVAPLLLPWLPGRQFWLKGVQTGLLAGLLTFLLFAGRLGTVAGAGLVLWSVAAASYLAMNFTGSTPFTSISGVSLEMRRGLPLQIGCTVLAIVLWISGAFV